MKPSFSKFKKIPWAKQLERDLDLALESIYMIGQDEKYLKRLGFDHQLKNRLATADGKVFYHKHELQRALDWLSRDEKHLVKSAKIMTENFKRFSSDFEKFLKKYQAYNFAKQKPILALNIFQTFLEKVYHLIPYAFAVSICLEEAGRQAVTSHLAKSSGDPVQEYFQLLMIDRPNETNLEASSRNKIALMYRKAKRKIIPKIQAAIREHARKYGYLACYRPTDNPFTEGEILQDIKHLANKALATKTKDNKPSGADLSKYNLPQHIKELIKIMRENVWLRTYRREIINKGFYVMRPLYQRFAKDLRVEFADLRYVPSWEIIDYVKHGKPFPKSLLRERKQTFALVKINGQSRLFSGPAALPYYQNQSEKLNMTEIQGTLVFPGRVRGIVRIIKTHSDAKRFRSKEILVAHTMATWMNFAAEKCVGIVTDVGGVLNHTSIIARELKKPCIVGTRLATQAFANGDRVEVDATAGIVRKLNKK